MTNQQLSIKLFNESIEMRHDGNYIEAINLQKKSIEVNPYDPDIAENYYSLGKTYYLAGDYKKSVDCYKVYNGMCVIKERAILIDYNAYLTGDIAATQRFTSAYENLARNTGYAFRNMSSGKGPGDWDIWYRYMLMGKDPKSMPDMAKYKRDYVESDERATQDGMFVISIWFKEFNSNFDEAKQEIINLAIDIVKTKDNISNQELSLKLFKESLAMRHAGNYIEAINLQKKSIEVYPDDPDITENYYSLGKTYYLAGDYKKSVDCYKVYNGLCVIKTPVIVIDYNAYLTGDIAATQRFMSSYANLARNTGYAFRNISSGKGPGDWDIWYRYMLMGKDPNSMPDMAKYKRDNIESDERATEDGMFVISTWFKEFNSNFNNAKKEIINLLTDILQTKDNISSKYTYNKDDHSTTSNSNQNISTNKIIFQYNVKVNTTNKKIHSHSKKSTAVKLYREHIKPVTDHNSLKSLEYYYSLGKNFYLDEKYQKALDCYRIYHCIYAVYSPNIITIYLYSKKNNEYAHQHLLSHLKDLAKDIGYAYHFVNTSSGKDISDKWYKCTLRGEHPENSEDMLPSRQHAIESDDYCIQIGYSLLWEWFEELSKDLSKTKKQIIDIESTLKENSINSYSINLLSKFNNQESSNDKNVDIKSANHDNIYDNGTLKQKVIFDVPNNSTSYDASVNSSSNTDNNSNNPSIAPSTNSISLKTIIYYIIAILFFGIVFPPIAIILAFLLARKIYKASK